MLSPGSGNWKAHLLLAPSFLAVLVFCGFFAFPSGVFWGVGPIDGHKRRCTRSMYHLPDATLSCSGWTGFG